MERPGASLGEVLQRAYSAQLGGRLAEAERLYKLVLRTLPAQFDALHLLGVLEAGRGNNAAALRLIDRALKANPRSPEALNNRSNVLQALRRYDEALASCDLALAARPGFAQALNNRGNILHDLRRYEEAVASYEKALKVRPDYAKAHANRANALRDLRRYDEALASCDQALALDPELAEALNTRANLLHDLKRYEEAIACFDRALAVKPDYAVALANRGNLLRDIGRYDEALACCERAVALRPDSVEVLNAYGTVLCQLERHAEALAAHDAALRIDPEDADALSGRGNALRGAKRYEEALASSDRALAIRPDLAEVLSIRGTILRDLDRNEDALASYDQALAIHPDLAEVLSNRGLALQELGRFEEALASHARAVAAKPELPQANFNEGLCRLLVGDLKRGWEQYEWRWKVPPLRPLRHAAKPLWQGEPDIAGKTILLHAEQGLGDAIHFCRYATLVHERGATVFLELQAPLKSLLASVRGVARVIGRDDPTPDFDIHAPLLGVPRFFGTSWEQIPAAVPYLSAEPAAIARWREKLNAGPELKVGVAWSGNPKQGGDRKRSIPIERLLPMLSVPGIRWYGLQVGERAADLARLPPGMVSDLSPELSDFAETAAVMANLDLVIGVDTSVAHFAGALGRPGWIMLAFVPAWQWLLDREDSPWYPTLRLFRQPRPGDWESVVARVTAELERLRR
jgi:tetratricopeptide (TPR) repeat protein